MTEPQALPGKSNPPDQAASASPAVSAPANAALVYDGECPFCTRFATMVRLRAAVGEVALVDARAGGPVVERLRAKGIDLDRANVFSFGGRDYVGAEALTAIAMLAGLGGGMGKAFAWVMRGPRRARMLYPTLRGLRNLALKIKGAPQIGGTAGNGL